MVKHRFLSGGQQILRVDTEEPLPAVRFTPTGGRPRPAPRTQARAIVLSDYDKGAVSDDVARRSIDAARERGIPSIVDSKRHDPSVFAGCTVIAPNHMEATRMTGTSDPEQAAGRIAALTGSAVVVTLGAEGMLLFDAGRVDRVRSQAREVSDVTGAGDSVTAGLTTALVEGATLVEAAEFATAVAAVAVAHTGTYAVHRSDLAGMPKTRQRS